MGFISPRPLNREMSTLALGLSPRSSAEMASRSSSEKARRVVLPRLSLNRGGHGGVDVAVLNEGPHEAEKEGEQERADV